jgi:hypothetical protein
MTSERKQCFACRGLVRGFPFKTTSASLVALLNKGVMRRSALNFTLTLVEF